MPSVRPSLAAAFLSTVLAVSASRSSHAAGTGTITETKIVPPYRLVLDIGPLEKMYSKADAKKAHPTSGEIMISGTMVMSGMGMSGPMPNHHLELHIFNAASGTVIGTAKPTITLTSASGKLVSKVPIAVMIGVHAPASDLHYGNNVALKSGHYHVLVTVGAAKATFDVMVGTAPGSMPGM